LLLSRAICFSPRVTRISRGIPCLRTNEKEKGRLRQAALCYGNIVKVPLVGMSSNASVLVARGGFESGAQTIFTLTSNVRPIIVGDSVKTIAKLFMVWFTASATREVLPVKIVVPLTKVALTNALRPMSLLGLKIPTTTVC
jgi:hypothetical protein